MESTEQGRTNESRRARAVVEYVKACQFHAHRGVIDCWRGYAYAAFGNDGFSTDPRTRREVELFRAWCREHALAEEGFVVDADDGYSWAMVLRPAERAAGFAVTDGEVEEALWECWTRACDEHRFAGAGVAG